MKVTFLPEPGAMLMLGAGIVALAVSARVWRH
ncbi:MAG TPA: PEP-CTERM sorting domain-containing protein [Myxococcota bacterium]